MTGWTLFSSCSRSRSEGTDIEGDQGVQELPAVTSARPSFSRGSRKVRIVPGLTVLGSTSCSPPRNWPAACRRILAGLKAKAAKNKPAGPSNLAELLAREESDSAA